MRTASETQYRLQNGDDGYLFVQLTNPSLDEGEIQVFRYTYDGEAWRSEAIDNRWCSGIHPTDNARDLWDRMVALGYTQNKSGLFSSTTGVPS